MRQEEFKMERTGLVEIGQVIPITEGKLPNSYYYTLGKAYAMSANYPAFSEALHLSFHRRSLCSQVDSQTLQEPCEVGSSRCRLSFFPPCQRLRGR